MTQTARNAASGATFTLALLRAASRKAATLFCALRHRAEMRKLHAWDDRMLKDIGLSRADVTAALDTPLGVDPSCHLAEVAGGGRRRAAQSASPPPIHRLRGADADVRPRAPACA